MPTLEDKARQNINETLEKCGWKVQDTKSANLQAGGGLRLRHLPLVEPQRIFNKVERRLSVIDELEATVEANLTRASRLRQAILNHAFSGRLNGSFTRTRHDFATTQDLL